MCGYFVTSSRRRNHVCVPEGAQSLGRGGLFHYAGRPTFTYYIRLFALNLVDACSFSCWCWTFFLLLPASPPRLWAELFLSHSCHWVAAHNLFGLCWSANNNLWLESWSTQCGSENSSYSFWVALLPNWKWRLPPSLGLYSFLNGCQTRLSYSSSPETFSSFGFPSQ